jgi:hypothetical protein
MKRKNAKKKKEQEVQRIFRLLAAGAPKPERNRIKQLVRIVAKPDYRAT